LDIGYLDGRDLEAQPPLTVGTINLWDSPARKRVVARLRHGTKVRILAKEWNEKEGRWYYRVRRSLKWGWIPESFLSAEYQEPIGDVV
jgi:hypothetical protein